MNLRPLTFFWTHWSLPLSVAAVVATAALCYTAWRRSGYRRSTGITELARLALVAVAAVLFNQPEWVEYFRPTQKPTVAVLYDQSVSMNTRDVVDSRKERGQGKGDRKAGTPRTRREASAALADSATWASLAERMDVAIQPFATASDGGTDLNGPLLEALEKHDTLRGVVLVSDGDWNEGRPPVEAASRLRLKGVPVFAVAVGSPTRLPDVELISLDLPASGVVGKSVRVGFSIESSLPREHQAQVVLRTSKGEEIKKEVTISPGRTSDWIAWKTDVKGNYDITIEVPVHHDELLKDNNRLTAPITIDTEQLRVLLVESVPRWEYRYLRNALSRDPGINLSCLLFHPGLSKVGGGNKDYITAFPERIDQLTEYDVVFLGDVGLDDGQLTAEQCRMLKGLVAQQASGLVLMPGARGRQLSLLKTELADLYPVVLDRSQPGGWGSRTPDHFELTETGRRSLLTRLADTQDENAAVWEGLPGFQWYAAVERAHAGSEVLCVHKSAANAFGRVPLLVTRTYGVGKVLFMGTDGAWRWRKGVEDKYHYRFWGQVVRWMAYQRNKAKGKSVFLYHDPEHPTARNTMTLYANLTDASGEPVQDDEVSARITAPSGKTQTVRFVHAGDEWGLFSAPFTPEEPGRYALALRGKRVGAALDTELFVQGGAVERVGRPARLEVLDEVARVTEGKLIEWGDQTSSAGSLGTVLNSLAALPDPPPDVRRLRLWSHPLLAGVLVALLGAFWTARKIQGLV